MARKPLYDKDKAYKRTINDTLAEKNAGYGRLLDLAHGKTVEMFWDFNDKATADGVFRLKVGKEEVFLDADQFNKFLRWV